MAAFQGNTAATVNIAVSASTQRVAIPNNNSAVRVANDGTATVWITFGDVTVEAATATGIPVLAGTVETFRLSSSHVAAIALGATGTIYFTPGEGE